MVTQSLPGASQSTPKGSSILPSRTKPWGQSMDDQWTINVFKESEECETWSSVWEIPPEHPAPSILLWEGGG